MLGLLLLNGLLGSVSVLLSKRYARLIALCSLAISWYLFYQISLVPWDTLSIDFAWIRYANIRFQLGLDGLSWLLCGLTLLINTVVFLALSVSVTRYVEWYLGLFLFMQTTILGVFLAQDAIVFYCFWESMLIPMYLCIGIWGSSSRSYAAMKFFLYTFLGSLLMLLGLVYLGISAGSFAFSEMVKLPLGFSEQQVLFVLLLAGFAVKIPMFPLHTWLPNAHTEAPAEGSVILAALMLKVGAYGLMRICLPILPDASAYFSPVMIVLSLVSVLYVGMVAYSQSDIKQLIAYASVAHMGFVTLGLFMMYYTQDIAIAKMSYSGAIIQMITHAFGSGALFLAFGFLYAKVQERNVANLSGVATQLPWFSMFFMLFVLSTIGVPATAGFVGEWTVIIASLHSYLWVGILSSVSLVISAAYLLNMFRKVFYGEPSLAVASVADISWSETVVLSILAIMILAVGIYPAWLFEVVSPSVHQLVSASWVTKLGGL